MWRFREAWPDPQRHRRRRGTGGGRAEAGAHGALRARVVLEPSIVRQICDSESGSSPCNCDSAEAPAPISRERKSRNTKGRNLSESFLLEKGVKITIEEHIL